VCALNLPDSLSTFSSFWIVDSLSGAIEELRKHDTKLLVNELRQVKIPLHVIDFLLYSIRNGYYFEPGFDFFKKHVDAKTTVT
jgi:hypothetical protein